MITIQYRVPYADTDQMGVVYYANYLVYFERSRNELLRQAGFTYLEMEKQNVALPVTEAFCQYKASARYDDLLDISARVAEIKGVRIRIECEVRCSGKLLVSGHTIHACMNMQTRRPVRVPEYLYKLFPDAEK